MVVVRLNRREIDCLFFLSQEQREENPEHGKPDTGEFEKPLAFAGLSALLAS
jgi:hypothetical protein